jgi:glycosyltransferase involved in cell wall biosynthesis
MKKLKVLVIHTNLNPDQSKHSAVDAWRLVRPMRELQKHVDWQIDYRPTLVPEIQKYKDKTEFTAEEMEKAFKDVSSYDIVFSSYQANPTMYTLLKVAADKTGTQYIMDVDDDMFAINPDNPIWTKMTDEKIYYMQRMIADNSWISTTTEALADVFRKRRQGLSKHSVFVNPNFISNDYQHPGFDNGDKLVIGYFGGSAHYKDMHDSGVLPALRRIMHEHKNVYFKSVGMIIDDYLPKARMVVEDGKKGAGWLNEVYPSLNFDIALGPILDNIFNNGKSNIKWQEATRAGSCFVASNIGPYKTLLPGTALPCRNTEDDWYRVLNKAVTDAELRKKTVNEAQRVLESQYRLENHWERYKDMFETVYQTSNSPVLQAV